MDGSETTQAGPESGLQRIHAAMARGDHSPMADLVGMRVVEAEEGRVVIEAEPDATHYNPMGTVHGGYTATILDTACGQAVLSAMPQSRAFTTAELKISYHRALTAASGTIRAEGRIVTIGRRVGFSEARLYDGAGKLCASASSTLILG